MEAPPSVFRNYIWPWIQTALEFIGNVWWFTVLIAISVVIGVFTFLTFMAAWGWIPVGGLLLATAALPVQASQREINANFAFAGDVLESVLNSIVEILNNLLDCVNGVILIYNFLVELLSSISKRVTKVLNEIVGDFPALFEWARFQQMEKLLSQEENFLDAGLRANTILREARMRMPNMTHLEQKHYIQWMENEIDSLPFVDPSTRFAQFPLEIFCGIIDKILQFLLDILDLVVDFLLEIVDFIFDEFFDDLNLEVEGPLVLIIVQFILDALLDAIPFGECFRNIPYNLFACLCPWIYDQPYSFPFGQDLEVPERVENALIGCICLVEILGGNVDLNTDDGPVDLLIRCLGIDVLIQIFEGFLNFVTQVLEPLYAALEFLLGILESAFNDLLSAFDTLEDLLDDICDLLNCKKKRESTDRRVDAYNTAIQMRDTFVEYKNVLLDRSTHRQKTLEAFRKHIDEHPRYKAIREKHNIEPDTFFGATGDIAMRKVMMMNTTINMWTREVKKEFERDPPMIKFARKFDELGKHPQIERFQNHFSTKYGEEGGVHARSIGNMIRDTTHVVARSMHTLGSDKSIYDALEPIDFKAGILGIQNLAQRVREHNGGQSHKFTRRVESRLRFMVASFMGGERFPRVVREFSEKYPDDKESLRQGLEFVRRYYGNETMGVEAMLAAAQNGTEFDVRLEAVRARVQQQKAEYNAYREEIDDLRTLYKNAMEQRDPVGLSIALTANGVTLMATAAYTAAERIVVVGAAFALAIFTLLLQIFIMPILSILGEIATSFVLRVTTSDEEATETAAFDFFSPFYYLLINRIEKSFVEGQGLTFAQTFDTVDKAGNILVDQLNILAIYFIRHYLCLIPQVICPPKPPVTVQGRGAVGFFDWISEVIFCDPTQTCGTYNSTFNNAPCRCPVQDTNCFGDPDPCVQRAFYRKISDVPLQRYATPDNPCTFSDGAGRGKQQCYPFAPSGNFFSTYDFDVAVDYQCDTEYGYEIDNVHWANASSIWQWLGAILGNTLISLRYAIRMIFRGYLVDWRVLLLALIIILLPCPCFLPIGSLLATGVVLLNVGTILSRATGEYVRDISEYNKDRFLIGRVFTFVLDNLFFGCNVKPGNPFGDPCPSETPCFIWNIFSALVSIFAGLLIFGVFFHFLFPMGALALVWLFFRVVLIIPYAIIMFFWMVAISLYLNKRGVGRVSAVMIAGEKKNHSVLRIGSSAPHAFEQAGITQAGAPVHVPMTGRVIIRTSQPRREYDQHLFKHTASMVGRSLWYTAKNQKTQLARDLLVHNPIIEIARNAGSTPPQHDVLLHTHEHPAEGFPWENYIVDENNVPLSASVNYRIASAKNFYK